MTCSLLDIGCHAGQVAFDLWHSLSLPSKALIIIGLLSIAGGAMWGAAKALKAFGGWPAVAGAAAVLLGLAIAVWPKAGTSKRGDDFTGEVEGEDAKGPFQFGADRTRPKKKRPTIFDAWRR